MMELGEMETGMDHININENGGATDDFVLKLISRGNTASLHTWNIFYKEPISINTISRNTGGRGLVYLDLIISAHEQDEYIFIDKLVTTFLMSRYGYP
jgi:hypothetical protein